MYRFTHIALSALIQARIVESTSRYRRIREWYLIRYKNNPRMLRVACWREN